MFNRYNPPKPMPPVNPAQMRQDDAAAIQAIIAASKASAQSIDKLVDAITKSYAHQYSFSKYPAIDLATAHVDLPITTVRPIDFLQIWCDGGRDGISIKIGNQSNEPISLDQMPVIPLVDNPEKIYFTNDVRQGRSKAVLYFVRGGVPLTLNYGGLDISLAELAARNGSINTFDRRGQVMWMDSFEDGMQKWLTSTSGTAYILATTAMARTGQNSCKMYNPAAETCQLIKGLPYASESPFGLEVSFSRDLPGGTANLKIEFEVDVYNGLVSKTGKLIYDEDATSLYYLDSTGADVLLSNAITIAPADINFNTVKLVIDSINNKYVRGIFNGYTFDMSTFGLFSAAAVGGKRLLSIVNCNTADGANPGTAYVDDFIVTTDEK